MPPVDLRDLRAARRKTGADRSRLTAGVAAGAETLKGLDLEVAAARRRGDTAAVAGLTAERERKAAEQTSAWKELHAFDKGVRERLDGLLERLDPCAMDSAPPLLLLPVRVETRFSADSKTLKVRIYPDAVHMDPLDRRLSAAEQDAARTFWSVAWRATDEGYADAWDALVTTVSPKRARWTAQALRPVNLDRRLQDPAPEFPVVEEMLAEGLVARLLPDRFVVVAVQNDRESRVKGRPIKSALRMGLFADTTEEPILVNGVTVTEETKWIASYEAAVEEGMGVSLTLAAPGKPVDRLYVYGVRRTTTPEETAAELAALLESRMLLDQFAIVPQGSPTNNSEDVRSDWRRSDERPAPPARDPADAAAVGPSYASLAAALGLDPAVFADAPASDRDEGALARAMNVILWRASWGMFLDMLPSLGAAGAPLTDQRRREARRLHRDAVWGRGPLPAIRVGDQPYGVLPVGATDRSWNGAGFENDMLKLLRQVRTHWRNALTQVDRMRPEGGAEVSETLLALLGEHGVSVGVGARETIAGQTSIISKAVRGEVDTDDEAETFLSGLAHQVLGQYSPQLPPPTLSKTLKPIRLPLAKEGDGAYLAALKAGGGGDPKSVLQALAKLGWKRLNESKARASGDGRVLDMAAVGVAVQAAGGPAFGQFIQNVDAASPQEFEMWTERLAGGVPASASLAELQPVPAHQQTYGELFASATTEAGRVAFADLGVLQWLTESTELEDVREAIDLIAASDLDADALSLLVGESLDVASHRFDAWITGVVERRRRAQRAATPKGIAIGAFGWLDDILPRQRQAASAPGYIHAPSVTQAKTAGVLRSAYQAHDGAKTGAFAIDLTSARVRDAVELIRGMRNGQELSALLGYRVERELQDRGLERFILVLRREAPLRQGKLTDRGAAQEDALRDAVSAGDVVDGVALAEAWKDSNGRGRIKKALKDGPTDNPYAESWPDVTDAHIEGVAAAVRAAAESIDAVADVLLAESVHQLVKGDLVAAAAAIDAGATGDSTAPLPAMIATPAGGPFVGHQLLILAAGGASWAPAQPRAKAEPRLEAWAAARLGDAADIVVHVAADGARRTFAETGLCALDLVYGSDEPLSLAREVGARLGLAGATFASSVSGTGIAFGEAVDAAKLMRGLFASSRPLGGEDLGLGANGAREVGPASLTEAAARLNAALADFKARLSDLDAALLSADAAAIARTLSKLYEYGLAAPTRGRPRDVGTLAASAARQRIGRASGLLAGPIDVDALTGAGEAIFGDGFRTLAGIDAPAGGPDAWSLEAATPPPGATPGQIRRFLADFGSVRGPLGRYAQLRSVLEALGRPPVLKVAQIVGDGDRQPQGWVGADPFEGPAPDCSVASFVIDAVGGFDPSGPTFGLIVDYFVDRLPSPPTRTSGIAFNTPAASARPPQTLLIAVPPDDGDWSSAKLQEVLRDTAELARLRAVRLEHTAFAGQLLPALYVQSYSLQGETVLDFAQLAIADIDLDSSLRFLKETP